jgi:hypothetical protein
MTENLLPTFQLAISEWFTMVTPYRFTPHIGIFSEVGYEVVDGPKNNFMQVNFGLKYAF